MTGADIKKAYIPAAAVAGALTASVLVYGGVGTLLKYLDMIPAPVKPPAAYVLKYAFYIVASCAVTALQFLKRFFPAQAIPEDALKSTAKQAMVRAALSEIPALGGLVLFVLTGFYWDFLLLVAFSLALEIFYFPRLGAWKDRLRIEYSVPPEEHMP